jgi:hypothetical protein
MGPSVPVLILAIEKTTGLSASQIPYFDTYENVSPDFMIPTMVFLMCLRQIS